MSSELKLEVMYDLLEDINEISILEEINGTLDGSIKKAMQSVQKKLKDIDLIKQYQYKVTEKIKKITSEKQTEGAKHE